VIYILGHGDENGVFGVNRRVIQDDDVTDEAVVSITDISDYLTAKNCELMGSRPKLIITEICSGCNLRYSFSFQNYEKLFYFR
jgi:hypothetical protein